MQSRIAMIEQSQQVAARSESGETGEVSAKGVAPGRGAAPGTMTMTSSNGAKYTLRETAEDAKGEAAPAQAPTGPHHTASGTIRNVKCSFPSKLTLTLEDRRRHR